MTLCMIGSSNSETDLELLKEAKKKFFSVFFVPTEGIRMGFDDKFSITYRKTDLTKFSAVYPRITQSLYSYAYQLLSLFPSEIYTPIRPISFLLAADRFFLLSVLRKRKIRTVNVWLARSPRAAKGILSEEEENLPVIMRVPGKETGIIANTLTEAKSVVGALGSLSQPVMMEEVVKDMVSCYVAGDEVIASVKKKTNKKDVLFSEGKLKRHKTDIETRHLAVETASSIDAQLARVDMSLNDHPKVINVSLAPSLKEPSKVTGVNLSRAFVGSLYDNYKRHKEKPMLMRFFEDAKSVVKDVLRDKSMVL